MKIREALVIGRRMLEGEGIDSAARDVRLFMAAVLEVEPGRLTLHLDDELGDGVKEAVYFADVLERTRRVPVSHILGRRAFFGRQFAVTPDVLDPRPETETLVEQALAEPFSTILDIGTGSGCILVSLLAERPQAIGTGTDLSPAALAVAQQNATALGVADRCAFQQGNWFQAVGGQYDLIVSNPPYIAVDEMDNLARELSYEPRMALTDEGDGLSAYRAITAGALAHLTPGGRLMVEIGPTQAGAVSEMFRAGGLQQVRVMQDLDGRDRVVVGNAP